MKIRYGIFVFLVLFSISTSGTSTLSINSYKDEKYVSEVPIILKINQSETFPETQVKILFKDVLEDSRCPSSVVCVWEGEARISVNVKVGNQYDSDHILTLNNITTSKAFFLEYSIQLTKIDPYPENTDPISKEQYEASFLLEKIENSESMKLHLYLENLDYEKYNATLNSIDLISTNYTNLE